MNAQMKMLLPLDLQFFSIDVDTSQIDDWYEEHAQEQGALEDVESDLENGQDTDEVIKDEVTDEEVTDEESQETDEEVPNEETPDHLSDDQAKRDAAFAEMRRQNQQYAQQAAFVKQMADAYGMTPEQLQQQWADDQLAKQAEEQGVPLEFLREQHAQRQELQQLRGQVQDQRIQADIANVIAKYSATNEQISATVAYAQENGLINALNAGAITFEAAHKLAHMDSLIEDAKKGAVQKNLAAKKQRQQAAPISPKGGAGANPLTDDQELDAQAEKYAQDIINGNYF